MACKFCSSPFDECDCWKGKLLPSERLILQAAAVAKWEMREEEKPIIVMRGQFGNRKAEKRSA
jgi:hypothetical protein